MVLGRHRAQSAVSAKSSIDESRGDGTNKDDETVVDDEQGNVLSHIISQLRPGADLSRVTLPTFILEPRSMLERITNFMAHPETLLPMPEIDDPIKRFVAVTKFYLSGWHIKPPGVKKPLNPILGEIFTGWWDYPDSTRGYYISEQTSHHPPKSSYFFMAPEHHIRIDGTLKPRSKFLGNSVGSFMEGIAVMRFTNRKERYFITQPNMYARGILFGKMKYELGDHASVSCPELGLEADIEFKVKGWVGGTYNAFVGHIKETKTGKNLFELTGFWDGEMSIKDLSTGKKETLFDATHAKETPPKARPLTEQGDRESQSLWAKTTAAIKKADHRTATDEKSMIEDRQREEAAQRGEGHEWQPKLFRKALGASGNGGPGDESGEESLDWVIDATVDSSLPPDEIKKQILAIAPVLPSAEQTSNASNSSKSEERHGSTASPAAPVQSSKSSNSTEPSSAVSAKSSLMSQIPTPTSAQPAQRASHTSEPIRGSNTSQTHTGTSTPFSPASTISQQSIPIEQMSSLSVDSHQPTAIIRAGDIHEPIQPKVRRSDSSEGVIEDFVDAEG